MATTLRQHWLGWWCVPWRHKAINRIHVALQWCHNELYGVSNHRHLDCLLNRLFRRRSRKTSNSASLAFVRGIHRWPVTGEFTAQRASNAENVPIWWRQLGLIKRDVLLYSALGNFIDNSQYMTFANILLYRTFQITIISLRWQLSNINIHLVFNVY